MIIRNYKTDDEVGWVRCRVLSFLDTAYYDNVLKNKETYKNPAIELVAVENDQIVGLLDIEYDANETTVCTRGEGLGGMIWHIATHPDFQRKGIATKLLKKAEQMAKEIGLDYLEAWTRDDKWVNKWYEKSRFDKTYSYLHVFAEGKNEVKEVMKADDPKFKIIQAFAHYAGDQQDDIKAKFKRVHECNCYEKNLK
ncbi:GNAT family N-acetyltransferase [Jeotgalibacillus haloalkalitolerans]|uniref:GNAT family N-acetyltransferase n=1 Tax=Jeotgalibacillus haloalkalitolerans TaxID=3104292 RepID=A0ABU5KN85_9BACL|nr:GNAT family N-acetyltransferase [Jeotgalibacillus sp. HH7-29]MDZ5712630.1 GNAT family N-acetyltransferase [Jeotgalibacillus sp. HH7-29]